GGQGEGKEQADPPQSHHGLAPGRSPQRSFNASFSLRPQPDRCRTKSRARSGGRGGRGPMMAGGAPRIRVLLSGVGRVGRARATRKKLQLLSNSTWLTER